MTLRAAKLLHLLWIAGLLLGGCQPTSLKLNPYSLDTRVVPLSIGADPITFYELAYDARQQRLIVPAAESGQLLLIDPTSQGIQSIEGFSQRSPDGLVVGATSAVIARDLVYALDHTARQIRVADPTSGQLINTIELEGIPDYIRFETSTSELWVTEPQSRQIEIFKLDNAAPDSPERVDAIQLEDGPENLVFYRKDGLAFTNQPSTGMTTVIQVSTHGIIAQWGNGCSQSRGMSVDEERGYLFIACGEGKLVVLDIENDGFPLASQNYGGELNAVVYNPDLRHIYLPSGASAILAVFAVQAGEPAGAYTSTGGASDGQVRLVRLGTADTAPGAGCATVDDENNIWVCDPANARLFVIEDTFPKSD